MVSVTHWPGGEQPTEVALVQAFQQEGLAPYRWSNAPGDTYAAHQHDYHKVIYVVAGSITFGLTGTSRRVRLGAGDRLDLPPHTTHNATVGPEGVVCLEAHRP